MTAAELDIWLFCWRTTALCIAMPRVSLNTKLSRPMDVAALPPAISVPVSVTELTIWSFKELAWLIVSFLVVNQPLAARRIRAVATVVAVFAVIWLRCWQATAFCMARPMLSAIAR